MNGITLEIVPKTFRGGDHKYIQQGETWVGPENQGSILKSCICIGFHHAQSAVGAISHITGHHERGGHSISGALGEIRAGLRRHGLRLEECSCFLIGGATRARDIYDEAERELIDRGITFDKLDVLGNFHRKFIFHPATGRLRLFKRQTPAAISSNAAETFAADSSLKRFHDPKRRLLTGASLFFRNKNLFACLTGHVLPEVFSRQNKRLHIWCAGCSNGMEVYSIAMAVLDYMKRKAIPAHNFRILGTDISEEALETARAGKYAISAWRSEAHAAMFRAYTEKTDLHHMVMGPELRRAATFISRDIRRGSRGHRFEMVICDHVLQYFDHQTQLDMLAALTRASQPDGFAYIKSPSSCVDEEMENKHGFKCLDRHFFPKSKS